MATYASVADLVAYTDGIDLPAPGSPEHINLEKILSRAEQQIDGMITWDGDENVTAHRRVTPADLDQWDQDCLKLATCAQAEYRLHMGEDFFKGGQYKMVSGPDFQTQGSLPLIGPRTWEELSAASPRLFRITNVATAGCTCRFHLDGGWDGWCCEECGW